MQVTLSRAILAPLRPLLPWILLLSAYPFEVSKRAVWALKPWVFETFNFLIPSLSEQCVLRIHRSWGPMAGLL